MKILIPTCTTDTARLQQMINEINYFSRSDAEVIVSNRQASAAVNRNHCLDHLERNEVAIMLDDDIRGFYSGWMNDLTFGLLGAGVVMCSARLLNPDGTFGPSCSRCPDAFPLEIPVKRHQHCMLPTAAIAFVHRGHRFDEEYLGSGWEDNDWCFQYLRENPNAIFIQSNRCKLIHLNEMKSQHGDNWKHNRDLFYRKWVNQNVST